MKSQGNDGIFETKHISTYVALKVPYSYFVTQTATGEGDDVVKLGNVDALGGEGVGG